MLAYSLPYVCNTSIVSLDKRIRYSYSGSSSSFPHSVFPVTGYYRTTLARDSIRYSLCLARYMLSTVRLCVRRVDHTKTVEVRIMKFSLHVYPFQRSHSLFRPPYLVRSRLCYRIASVVCTEW